MSFPHSRILKLYFTRLSAAVRRVLSRCRPWLELIDGSAFSRPSSVSDATTRIRKNLIYFRINYLSIFAFVVALSLLSHPLSLFALLSVIAAWLFFYFLRPSDQPLVVFNRTLSDREAMWTLIAVTIFVIFMTDVVSLLSWASMVGVGIICVHGAVRDPEDLFLDDQDLTGSGLFSLGGSGAVSFTGPSPIASEV